MPPELVSGESPPPQGLISPGDISPNRWVSSHKWPWPEVAGAGPGPAMTGCATSRARHLQILGPPGEGRSRIWGGRRETEICLDREGPCPFAALLQPDPAVVGSAGPRPSLRAPSQPRARWLFGARARPQDQLLSPCTGSVTSSPRSQQPTSTVPAPPWPPLVPLPTRSLSP